MKDPHPLAGLAFLALCTPGFAQEPIQHPADDGMAVHRGLETWRAEHGSGWRVVIDPATGRAELLYGSSTAPAFDARSDSDWFAVAQLFIEAAEAMFGVESATLVPERVSLLPLGLVGTSDKMTMRFGQQVAGVPVLGGHVNVLTDLAGNLLSIQSTALPHLGTFPTSPSLAAERAASIAVADFMAVVREQPTTVSLAKLGIRGVPIAGGLVPHLVWEVDVQWFQEGYAPEGTTYSIDAHDGVILERAASVHHLDVGGTVTSRATPGTLPDIVSNPTTQQAMPRIRVQSSAGTVITDDSGDFNFPGVNGPLDCTFTYVGPFASVTSSYSLVSSLSGTGNTVLMNPASVAATTAQANAFSHLVQLRNWIRSVNPADATGDINATANCNLSSTCNAFFNGSSVNFYSAGGGCVNTSYSSVVAHEMGHWLNVLYGTGNGSDGMGEGNADVFAMYLYDDPVIGKNFTNTGGIIRTGTNLRQFCGDNNPGCHGGVHNNGEVWMGAAWKVRVNLKATHGVQAGGDIANAIFNGWMNAYDQTQIKSVIELQWLTLDDDNGNLDDGTPNYGDIDAAFRLQGFPGFDLALISISNVTELPDTTDQVGPYTVEADVMANFATSIASAELHYQVGNGPFLTAPMFPLGGDLWTGFLPGQTAPAIVKYYITVTDSDGNPGSFPANAPADAPGFFVGDVQVLYSNGFEAVGDEGWTHGSLGGTSNSHDDFQRLAPLGQSGDPSAAANGIRAWGNDMGHPGWNGAYQHNQHNFLRSPQIATNSSALTLLRYNRWLTVQAGQSDQARIKVNGTTVWSNARTGDHVDGSWTSHQIDISQLAGASAFIQLEFSLQTNGSVAFGGWNIDDVQILTVGPIGGCASPSNYGAAKTNSLGQEATLSWLGTTSAAANDFRVTMDLALPNTPLVLFSGAAPDSTPFFGGLRLVAPPLVREKTTTTDFLGGSDIAVDVTPAMVGTSRYYQQWYRDPADPFTVGLTDGLQATFCD